MRRGFSLIELIFVIILLGILGVLSSEILLNIYRTYIMQKGVTKVEISLKTTVEQLSNYLERSITPSVALYNGTDYIGIDLVNRTNGDLTADPTKKIVWIAKDIESMQGLWNGTKLAVGYSGLANVKRSQNRDIVTYASNLSYVDSIVESLTGVTTTSKRSALYFVYGNSQGSVEERFWKSGVSSLFPIESLNVAENNLTLTVRPKEIGDRFYLSYSAYALSLVGDTLKLVWNFRPWNGESLESGDSFTLLEGVSKFQLWSESGGAIIRVYLCKKDRDISSATGKKNWEYCKESVIVR